MEPELTRRTLLRAGGVLGVGALLGACGGPDEAAPSTTTPPTTTPLTTGAAGGTAPGGQAVCVLSPEQMEGPFYLDLDLVRRDITEGRPGLTFDLVLTVVEAGDCTPIADASVDVWHCDAEGDYSGFAAGGGGEGTTYLRGVQSSDPDGVATFRTIYPGWYQGRTAHIHVKVHTGGRSVHTGQLYFDQAFTDAVYTSGAYAAHGPADTTNDTDGLFAAGGSESLLAIEETTEGYRGSITLGVRPMP